MITRNKEYIAKEIARPNTYKILTYVFIGLLTLEMFVLSILGW
jgi:hypothetical protein